MHNPEIKMNGVHHTSNLAHFPGLWRGVVFLKSHLHLTYSPGICSSKNKVVHTVYDSMYTSVL